MSRHINVLVMLGLACAALLSACRSSPLGASQHSTRTLGSLAPSPVRPTFVEVKQFGGSSDASDGAPVVGRRAHIEINGTRWDATTNAYGVATFHVAYGGGPPRVWADGCGNAPMPSEQGPYAEFLVKCDVK